MKCLLAATGAALIAGAAQAGNVTVHYHDSDLASQNAAGAFYQTLDHAAHKACRSNEALSPDVRRMTQECRALALDTALADIDNEYLWMHHDKPREATIMISQRETPETRAYAQIHLAKQPGS